VVTDPITSGERMELRHVRTFVVLAEVLHFGRTARKLRVAQSAVSQTIRALEEDVGAPLFVRGPGGVRLTIAGEHFLGHARRALGELDDGASTARSAGTGEVGRLALRLGPISGLTILPRVVARFRRELPRVDLRIEPAGAADPIAAIADGRADLAFVSAAKHDHRALASELVEDAPLVAALPARHRLARRASVAFGDLSGEVLLVPEHLSDPTARAAFERRCRDERFEPGAVLEIGHLDALLAFVAAGAGVSFVPELVARVAFPGVALVRVRPAMRVGIVAVWSRERQPATAERFLAMMREERRQLDAASASAPKSDRRKVTAGRRNSTAPGAGK
jgi:DNA-binding transcriptional LysR family regulator